MAYSILLGSYLAVPYIALVIVMKTNKDLSMKVDEILLVLFIVINGIFDLVVSSILVYVLSRVKWRQVEVNMKADLVKVTQKMVLGCQFTTKRKASDILFVVKYITSVNFVFGPSDIVSVFCSTTDTSERIY